MRRFPLIVLSMLLAAAATADSDPVATEVQSRQEAAKKPPRKAKSDGQTPALKPDADAKGGAGTAGGDVKMSGISILGNQEAPKSLVIVPWKSSRLGDAPGISRLPDDSTQPVDKDVFMRELAYYEIRSNPN